MKKKIKMQTIIISVLVVFLFLVPIQALSVPQEEAGELQNNESETLLPPVPPEKEPFLFFRSAFNFRAGIGYIISAWSGSTLTLPPSVDLIYSSHGTFGNYNVVTTEYNEQYHYDKWTGFEYWHYLDRVFVRNGNTQNGYVITNKLTILGWFNFKFVYVRTYCAPVVYE